MNCLKLLCMGMTFFVRADSMPSQNIFRKAFESTYSKEEQRVSRQEDFFTAARFYQILAAHPDDARLIAREFVIIYYAYHYFESVPQLRDCLLAMVQDYRAKDGIEIVGKELGDYFHDRLAARRYIFFEGPSLWEVEVVAKKVFGEISPVTLIISKWKEESYEAFKRREAERKEIK